DNNRHVTFDEKSKGGPMVSGIRLKRGSKHQSKDKQFDQLNIE
ncbi:hypothetical protein NPIL_571231, partial [Nephila pilipes]